MAEAKIWAVKLGKMLGWNMVGKWDIEAKFHEYWYMGKWEYRWADGDEGCVGAGAWGKLKAQASREKFKIGKRLKTNSKDVQLQM